MIGKVTNAWVITFLVISLSISGCITITTGPSDSQVVPADQTQSAIEQQLTQIAVSSVEDANAGTGNTSGAYILGQKFTSSEGGFSFTGIEGFQVEILEGGYTVVSPEGASMNYGPLIGIDSDSIQQEDSMEEAFENVMENLAESPSMTFYEVEYAQVDGWDGLSADFTFSENNQSAAGNLVYARAGSEVEILVVGVTPADQWEQFAPIFREVVDSITLMDVPAFESEPLCGNGICGDFENSGNCPQDCGDPQPEPLCGDGYCGDFEHPGNCPQDCGDPQPEPLCGDGYCGDFEHAGNCPQDCD